MSGWTITFLCTTGLFFFLFIIAMVERERPHRVVKIIAKNRMQHTDEDGNLTNSYTHFFTVLGEYEGDIAKRVEVDSHTYNLFEVNNNVIYKV